VRVAGIVIRVAGCGFGEPGGCQSCSLIAWKKVKCAAEQRNGMLHCWVF